MSDDKPNFGPGYTSDDDKHTEVSATAQLDRMFEIVNSDRGAVYGHPYVDFGRAAAMKTIIADCPDPRIRHVLDMLAVKICRLIETPGHVDSWVDIAGYARTACMVLDAEETKNAEG